MAYAELSEDELHQLYVWVDTIPLSRPKKNIGRDFSDGVLMAEVVHHYFPRLVELHNYSPAHNSVQKLYNWTTLNNKVFKRMGFTLPREQCEAVANCQPGAVERTLRLVRAKMAKFQENGGVAVPRAISREGTNAISGAAAAAAAVTSAGSAYYEQHQQQPGAQHYMQQQQPGPPDGEEAAGCIAALHIGGGAGGSSSKLVGSTTVRSGAAVEHVLKASLVEREQQLAELRETNEILETKVRKLETLVRLKDAKIQALLAKMAEAGAEAAAEQQGIVP